jgi:RNase P/RNase MRP subunit p29
MRSNDNEVSCKPEMDAILASSLPDMAKMARAFEGLTGFIIKDTGQQIELAQAMGNRQEVVKQQIKMETLKHARTLFQTCYLGVTGKAAWDEPAKR